MKNGIYPYYEAGDYTNLSEFMKYIANKYSDKIAFKYSTNKVEVKKTYEDFYTESKLLAKEMYFRNYKNINVGILGENSYNWILAYLGNAILGNIVVPIDKELECSEVENIINEADISAIFISNTYKDYALQLKKDFPNLKIIFFNEIKEYLEHAEKVKIELPIIQQNRTSTIIFTSGTTSKPKGVILTHKNIVEDVRMCQKQFVLTGDSVLLLPLHHTFAFTVNVLFALTNGYAVCIPNSLKKIDETLKKYKPSSLVLVPMLVEAFYNKIWKTIRKTKKTFGVKSMIVISNALLCIGIDIRKKIFKSIIEALGGNLDLIISGGAAMEEAYVKGFRNFGINVYNGYGITECSPVVSVNRNKYYKDGSVGTPLHGLEVKIDNATNEGEGEILVKGDVVMQGYYKNENATKEAMTKDGYFRTGDIGYIDSEGFIFITGRKKNVIILENGKNVYPEELEGKLQLLPEVKEIVIFENDKKIVAEIYPDFELIPKNQDAKCYLQKKVDEFNKKVPHYKKIEDIIIRDKEFEKTTTKKIKRRYTNVG